MKIKNLVLVSAFFPPSIGGTGTLIAQIGPELVKKGYTVSYANFEPYKAFSKLKRLRSFLQDLWKKSKDADLICIADMWSVLIPSVVICMIKRKRYVFIICGDHLWETYLTRTKEKLKLSLFYFPIPMLAVKEKIIYFLTRISLKYAYLLIFNTAWQRDIWQKAYNLKKEETYVVENALVTNLVPYIWNETIQKVIRCPVRDSEFKNVNMLKKAWESLAEKYPDVTLSFEYIDPQERARILSETYAVIQPSISDVAPNLICESVASGCPFICTCDSGIRNLLPDVGIYIDTTQEKNIHKSLETILDLRVHAVESQKIAKLNITRTNSVLAEEYHQIWSNWKP